MASYKMSVSVFTLSDGNHGHLQQIILELINHRMTIDEAMKAAFKAGYDDAVKGHKGDLKAV